MWTTEYRHRYDRDKLRHPSDLTDTEPFAGTVFVSRANQAAAFDRISRSSRSWRFSRLSRLSSARSAVRNPPSPPPVSRSDCATQLRIDCAVGSNSRDNSSGERPACTSSTICRRNSGVYAALVLPIVDSSVPNSPVSTKPGQLQSLLAYDFGQSVRQPRDGCRAAVLRGSAAIKSAEGSIQGATRQWGCIRPCLRAWRQGTGGTHDVKGPGGDAGPFAKVTLPDRRQEAPRQAVVQAKTRGVHAVRANFSTASEKRCVSGAIASSASFTEASVTRPVCDIAFSIADRASEVCSSTASLSDFTATSAR